MKRESVSQSKEERKSYRKLKPKNQNQNKTHKEKGDVTLTSGDCEYKSVLCEKLWDDGAEKKKQRFANGNRC